MSALLDSVAADIKSTDWRRISPNYLTLAMPGQQYVISTYGDSLRIARFPRRSNTYCPIWQEAALVVLNHGGNDEL